MSSYLKLFSPDTVRHELLMAGLYMIAYEMVKSSIVDQPRSFFLSAASTPEQVARERAEYRTEVLAHDNDPLIASALWHVQMGAISEEGISLIRSLRKHRNELAHELPAIIIDDARTVRVDQIANLYSLVTRIDKWWILNVHVPTNPDFDGVEVEAEDVRSGPMVLLEHLVTMLSRQTDESDHS